MEQLGRHSIRNPTEAFVEMGMVTLVEQWRPHRDEGGGRRNTQESPDREGGREVVHDWGTAEERCSLQTDTGRTSERILLVLTHLEV